MPSASGTRILFERSRNSAVAMIATPIDVSTMKE
jgi:hypothetical protein